MSDYLKLFSTAADQTAFRNGESYVEPHVSCLEDGTNVKYNKRIKYYVDLGLPSGTLWADRNLGASSQEDYGDYLGWGELNHNMSAPFDSQHYRYYDAVNQGYSKYNADDGLTELESTDDVVVAKIGDGWHIPTAAQFEELMNNCSSEEVTINSKKGVLFTSNNNNNTVFFPYAGCYDGSNHLSGNSEGDYWTVDGSVSSDPGVEYGLAFLITSGYNSPSVGVGGGLRTNGLSIRPVQGEVSDGGGY